MSLVVAFWFMLLHAFAGTTPVSVRAELQVVSEVAGIKAHTVVATPERFPTEVARASSATTIPAIARPTSRGPGVGVSTFHACEHTAQLQLATWAAVNDGHTDEELVGSLFAERRFPYFPTAPPTSV